MVSTGGVESTPPEKPESTKPAIPKGKGGIVKALDTPVKTLGQLKSVLEQNLGKKEGDKLYKTFMTSFVMTMLAPIRTAQQQAQAAARKMREQNK